MGKIASETAELLKEIILSCSAEDILPEELDNFIDFLAKPPCPHTWHHHK